MSAPKIINVLAISGSLRKKSANSGLVRHAMKIGNARNDVSISTFDIGKLHGGKLSKRPMPYSSQVQSIIIV